MRNSRFSRKIRLLDRRLRLERLEDRRVLAAVAGPTGEIHGMKWVYWRNDVRSAFYYWRKGELTIRDWLRSLRGRKTCAVWSWSDPVPFFADLCNLKRWLPTRDSRKRDADPALSMEEPRASEDQRHAYAASESVENSTNVTASVGT